MRSDEFVASIELIENARKLTEKNTSKEDDDRV